MSRENSSFLLLSLLQSVRLVSSPCDICTSHQGVHTLTIKSLILTAVSQGQTIVPAGICTVAKGGAAESSGVRCTCVHMSTLSHTDRESMSERGRKMQFQKSYLSPSLMLAVALENPYPRHGAPAQRPPTVFPPTHTSGSAQTMLLPDQAQYKCMVLLWSWSILMAALVC